MDTNTEIQTDQAEVSDPEPAPLFDYRGNGKVARLPKNLRDQFNHWLVDGLSYPEILDTLSSTLSLTLSPVSACHRPVPHSFGLYVLCHFCSVFP